MSPGFSTESHPAFAHIGLRENPGKNLNQVTCPDRESNPGHLVSRPDLLTVTPQSLMLAGSEFQSLGRAIVKEDEYEEVRWDGITGNRPFELVAEDEAAVSENEKDFSVLREEVELALREMKNGKATEVDGILIELPDIALGEDSPTNNESTFISKMEEQLEEEQFGFRKGKVSSSSIFRAEDLAYILVQADLSGISANKNKMVLEISRRFIIERLTRRYRLVDLGSDNRCLSIFQNRATGQPVIRLDTRASCWLSSRTHERLAGCPAGDGADIDPVGQPTMEAVRDLCDPLATAGFQDISCDHSGTGGWPVNSFAAGGFSS
ncbi:hypothetical protein ANN_17202 [Periplaneta americana]|uniref:Uncharacterized protein n=1 Tax=Periplaneta americana TaxID=6978 RepID=A0ABQ8SSA0_PERAM|nr:hypothetical protein ANN_17202 [Periplaneta americana]